MIYLVSKSIIPWFRVANHMTCSRKLTCSAHALPGVGQGKGGKVPENLGGVVLRTT